MLSHVSIAPILRPEQLRKLREIPGILKHEPRPKSFEHGGIQIPCSALTEISGPPGSGKTEWTLQFIASLSAAPKNSAANAIPGSDPRGTPCVYPRVAWIEDAFSANPRGFAEHGVDLRNFLFIEGGKDSLWAAHQVLRSQLFGVAVLWVRESILSSSQPSVELRKLQLSAEQAGVPLLLLSPQPRPSGANWPLALQIAMDPGTRRPTVLHYSPRSEEISHDRPRFQRAASASGTGSVGHGGAGTRPRTGLRTA
ncbi:MAG: hypothetical protein ACK5QT_03920 [Oligoflexia bacterium]|jgi:hypothetical protein